VPGTVARPLGCLERSEECPAGMRRWLLVRGDAEDPDEHASFLVFGPEETATAELISVCTARWQFAEGFAQAKSEVDLDQDEVRTWGARRRHATHCLLAHAYLVIMRQAAQPDGLHTRLSTAARGRTT
jgi:SRSO17 transposase